MTKRKVPRRELQRVPRRKPRKAVKPRKPVKRIVKRRAPKAKSRKPRTKPRYHIEKVEWPPAMRRKKKKARNVRGMGLKRRDRDSYMTPDPVALAICQRVFASFDFPTDKPLRVIEPSAGTGAFVRAVKTLQPTATVIAVDIDRKYTTPCHDAGATSFIAGRWEDLNLRDFNADLIIGNPPYSDNQGEVHARHALDQLRDGAFLAFLLPISFLGSQGRAKRLWYPPFGQLRYFFPLAERPSFFTNGRTDMVEYGVFVWCKGWNTAPSILPPLWVAPPVEVIPEAAPEATPEAVTLAITEVVEIPAAVVITDREQP